MGSFECEFVGEKGCWEDGSGGDAEDEGQDQDGRAEGKWFVGSYLSQWLGD